MGKTICILGNSVSLLVWPKRENPEQLTFAEHLAEMGWKVYNASKQGIMISDVFCYLEEEVISRHPQHIIIQLGIVEATFRARPRFLHRLFSNNNWKNSIINIPYRPPLRRSTIVHLGQIYRYIERALYLLGIKWRYLPPKLFKDALNRIIETCQHQSGVAKYILIGLTPINESFERVAPGTRRSVEQYNEIMKSMAKTHQNIEFVDAGELLSAGDPDAISPDSIHLTARGHHLLAKKIASVLIDPA